MASEGMIVQAKVAKLLSRRFGKPVLQPKYPLVLRNSVSNRKERLLEASCLTEMSVLMACWKENSFSDQTCSNEIKVFNECVVKAKADRNTGLLQDDMAASKVNKMLKRFPTIAHEI